jgi:hypothetical protein
LWLCRCYAALGDIPKARYLQETNKVAQEQGKTYVSSIVLTIFHYCGPYISVNEWIDAGFNSTVLSFSNHHEGVDISVELFSNRRH